MEKLHESFVESCASYVAKKCAESEEKCEAWLIVRTSGCIHWVVENVSTKQ